MTDDDYDWNDALDLILQDLESARGQPRQSVVVTALGQLDPLSAGFTRARDAFEPFLRRLFDLGVPFVTAAGNIGRDGSSAIDSIPQTLQDDANPIINVGAANFQGQRTGISKFGPKLSVYAPGEQVECKLRDEFQTGPCSGTSVGKSFFVNSYSILFVHTKLTRPSCPTSCRVNRHIPILRHQAMG